MSVREANRNLPLAEMQAEVQSVADLIWARVGRPAAEDAPPRILFLSMEAGAGSTTITAATALSLASNHRVRIHLLETHVEDPQLAGYLEMAPTPGLVDLLDGGAAIEDCLRPHPACPDLWVLPVGAARPSVPGEFTSDAAATLFEQASARARCVLIDAPPLGEHRESRALLEHADYVVLVLAARRTQKSSVERAQHLCADFDVPILGAVLNRYRSDMPLGLGEPDWA